MLQSSPNSCLEKVAEQYYYFWLLEHKHHLTIVNISVGLSFLKVQFKSVMFLFNAPFKSRILGNLLHAYSFFSLVHCLFFNIQHSFPFLIAYMHNIGNIDIWLNALASNKLSVLTKRSKPYTIQLILFCSIIITFLKAISFPIYYKLLLYFVYIQPLLITSLCLLLAKILATLHRQTIRLTGVYLSLNQTLILNICLAISLSFPYLRNVVMFICTHIGGKNASAVHNLHWQITMRKANQKTAALTFAKKKGRNELSTSIVTDQMNALFVFLKTFPPYLEQKK